MGKLEASSSSLNTNLFTEYREKFQNEEKALNVSTVSSTVSEHNLENYNEIARKIKLEPEDIYSTGKMDNKSGINRTMYHKYDKVKKRDSYPYATSKNSANQSANVSSSCNDIDIEWNNQLKKCSLFANSDNKKNDLIDSLSFAKSKSSVSSLYNQYSECASNGFDQNEHSHFDNLLTIKNYSANSKGHSYRESSNSSPCKDNHSTTLSESPAFSDSMDHSPNNVNYCDTILSKDHAFSKSVSSTDGPYKYLELNNETDFSHLKHQTKRKIMGKNNAQQINVRRTSRKKNPCSYADLSDDELYSSDDSYSPAKYNKKS